MKNLWGGRFKKGMHPALKCFSYSLADDGQLLEAELRVDRAWAKMLGRTGLILRSEAAKLLRGLAAVGRELIGKPLCEYLEDYEDIHTLIQARLEKKIGAAAKKIHTGRSRNDLVVTSTRVYLRDKIREIKIRIVGVEKSLVGLAKKAGDAMIPGLTHTRKAQPILLAHHLLAYVEMIHEDLERLGDCEKRVDVLALGSAALAGSSLRIDQKFLARELGFSKIASNSLAATGDRAFLAEFLSVLAILWMHLSRLAEDFILWNSEPFHFVELDDAFATGSSLMPQKKNPDVFELLRGRSGVIFGDLMSLLALQKGLPLSYNRDLQEDKPALFDAIRKTGIALEVLALTLDSSSFNRAQLARSLEDDNLFATDILEYLVRRSVPFSAAHETVGKVIRYALEQEKRLRDLSLGEWKKFAKEFEPGVYDLFDPAASVRAKRTIGSTHPLRVRSEIRKWEKFFRSQK